MEQINILLENNYTCEEFAYQLTAYEQYGSINFDEAVKDLIIKPYLDESDLNDLISEWNEYNSINGYENEFYYNDDDFFNEFFNGCEPMRIIQATYFGDYRYGDDYVKFNGYANLDSFSDYQVKRYILDDSDFIEWLYITNDIFDELKENENELCKMAIELVKEGY